MWLESATLSAAGWTCLPPPPKRAVQGGPSTSRMLTNVQGARRKKLLRRSHLGRRGQRVRRISSQELGRRLGPRQVGNNGAHDAALHRRRDVVVVCRAGRVDFEWTLFVVSVPSGGAAAVGDGALVRVHRAVDHRARARRLELRQVRSPARDVRELHEVRVQGLELANVLKHDCRTQGVRAPVSALRVKCCHRCGDGACNSAPRRERRGWGRAAIAPAARHPVHAATLLMKQDSRRALWWQSPRLLSCFMSSCPPRTPLAGPLAFPAGNRSAPIAGTDGAPRGACLPWRVGEGLSGGLVFDKTGE